MEVKQITKIIEKEQQIANKHYIFHCSKGDNYNLSNWFNGQRAVLRKLKARIKKLNTENVK